MTNNLKNWSTALPDIESDYIESDYQVTNKIVIHQKRIDSTKFLIEYATGIQLPNHTFPITQTNEDFKHLKQRLDRHQSVKASITVNKTAQDGAEVQITYKHCQCKSLLTLQGEEILVFNYQQPTPIQDDYEYIDF